MPSPLTANSKARWWFYTICRKFRRKRKASAWVWRKRLFRTRQSSRILLFKAESSVRIVSIKALALCIKNIGSLAGCLTAAVFTLTLPAIKLLPVGEVSASEVHLACAGIIGTILALVLSLSIIPAQKAADAFSPAILKLYARDKSTLWVFALLCTTALFSLFFGTGWTIGLSIRYGLALQFIFFGFALWSDPLELVLH